MEGRPVLGRILLRMGIQRCGADGAVPGTDGGLAPALAKIAVPDSRASRRRAAGNTGTAAICRLASVAAGSRHFEWNGDKGMFAGARFCPATGGPAGEGRSGVGGGRRGEVQTRAGNVVAATKSLPGRQKKSGRFPGGRLEDGGEGRARGQLL